MKPTSLLTILRKDLNKIPYKCHTVQLLSYVDKARLAMCLRFRQEIGNGNVWIKNVWFTDEAHFYLEGIVNSQNCRIWGKEAPNEVNERPLHSDKCTAWCALSALIGPLRFQVQGESITFIKNQERYRLQRHHQDLRLESQWFQQDGATPHTATATMRHLDE